MPTRLAQIPLSVAEGIGGAVYVGGDGVVREFTRISSPATVAAGVGSIVGNAYNGRPASKTVVGEITGMALDAAGNLVMADISDYGEIDKLQVVAAKSGTFYGHAMTAGRLYSITPQLRPTGLAIDSAGNVVTSDSEVGQVQVLAVRTGIFYGQVMKAGDTYTIAGNGTEGYNGDGIPALSAELAYPDGVATDHSGNVLIADTDHNRVRVVAAASGIFYGQTMTTGDTYVIAGTKKAGYSGDGGLALAATLNNPEGVAVDQAGNVLIADTLNGRIRVLAASTGTYYDVPMTAGHIYTVAGNGSFYVSGDAGPEGNAQLREFRGLVMDGSGNLVIGDADDNLIRVVAGSSGPRCGRAMTAGDIYTIAGTGIAGYTGDGGPGTAAELNSPSGPAADSAGNVISADMGNDRVRVIAAVSGTFYGRAMTAGDIYTIAGNGAGGYSGDGSPATSAELSSPAGVAVDANGNVLIDDFGNVRIRVVAALSGTFYGQAMTAGDIYTIAGNGTGQSVGDGGAAISCRLRFPMAAVVDQAGNVIIADEFDNRVRVIAATSGTFYGQAMSAGDIYTIAGNGGMGFSGDGRRGKWARLADPLGRGSRRCGQRADRRYG